MTRITDADLPNSRSELMTLQTPELAVAALKIAGWTTIFVAAMALIVTTFAYFNETVTATSVDLSIAGLIAGFMLIGTSTAIQKLCDIAQHLAYISSKTESLRQAIARP
jgi:hypothetical protein